LRQETADVAATAAAVGVLSSAVSHSELLGMIIEAAAEVLQAESAVVLLLDGEGDELVFDATFGVDRDDVHGARLPLGDGIAGLVAATGQPIAAASDEGDPELEPEILAGLDYVPRRVLCVPLRYGDRLIGVLEVLDREGTRTFTPRDVRVLGLLARQAAVAIQLSRQSAAHSGADGDRALRRTLELSELVAEIGRYGEDEARACRAVLESFAGYLRSRPGAASPEGGD
jgi:GAF domain-containing protein